jgi:hypothetical protein
MKRLLRLYPKAWRERYGAEVARMLDDTGSGPRDIPDLLRGALDAHAHPGPLGLPGGGVRGWFTADRVAGLLVIAAGVAWVLPYAALVLSSMSYAPGADTQSVALTAVPGLLVALAITALMARHLDGRRHRLLTAGAVTLVVAGSVGMIAVLVANATALGDTLLTLGGDAFMTLGTGIVLAGMLLAVAVMWDHAPVSRRSLVWLTLACALDLVFLAVYREVGFVMATTSAAGAGLGMLVGLAWIGVGRSVLQARSTSSASALAGDTSLVPTS